MCRERREQRPHEEKWREDESSRFDTVLPFGWTNRVRSACRTKVGGRCRFAGLSLADVVMIDCERGRQKLRSPLNVFRSHLQADSMEGRAHLPVETGQMFIGYVREKSLSIEHRLREPGRRKIRVVANGDHVSSSTQCSNGLVIRSRRWRRPR